MHDIRYLLTSIRVFDVVCKAGGVRAAADMLHVTPGAVSQQLKRLQESLGITLFRKVSRDVQLTDSGRDLAARVGPLFGLIESSIAEFVRRTDPLSIRVKATSAFATRWLMPSLAGFCSQYPEISVTVTTVAHVDAFESLDDAEIVVQQGADAWPGMHAELLFEDEFVPVCTPEMAAHVRSPDDVLQALLLSSMTRVDAWRLWFNSCGLPEVTLPKMMTLHNSAICYQAALDGVGIALMQRAFVVEDVASGRLVMPVDHVARPLAGYYMISDPRRTEVKSIRAFREWAGQIAAQKNARVRSVFEAARQIGNVPRDARDKN